MFDLYVYIYIYSLRLEAQNFSASRCVLILKGLNQQHEESEKDCQIPSHLGSDVLNWTCQRDLSQRREGVAEGLRLAWLEWASFPFLSFSFVFPLSSTPMLPPPTATLRSTFLPQHPSSLLTPPPHPISLIWPPFPLRLRLPPRPTNNLPPNLGHSSRLHGAPLTSECHHPFRREDGISGSQAQWANLALILCVSAQVCVCVSVWKPLCSHQLGLRF